MALHRDIYWVGRQWAVTGHGMQAIDQKLKGSFDIEVSRLWDDDLLESLRAKKWLNVEDFDKALAIARARFPQATLPVRHAGGRAGSSDRADCAASAGCEAGSTESDEPPKPEQARSGRGGAAAPSQPAPVSPAAAITTA